MCTVAISGVNCGYIWSAKELHIKSQHVQHNQCQVGLNDPVIPAHRVFVYIPLRYVITCGHGVHLLQVASQALDTDAFVITG